MNALAFTIVAYAVVLAGVLGWFVVRGGRRGPRTGAALGLVQVATTGLAVGDALTSLGGDGYDVATHVGYLVTAVVVLPVSYSVAGSDRGRWGNAAMAFACLLLTVVVIRMRQTGVSHA